MRQTLTQRTAALTACLFGLLVEAATSCFKIFGQALDPATPGACLTSQSDVMLPENSNGLEHTTGAGTSSRDTTSIRLPPTARLLQSSQHANLDQGWPRHNQHLMRPMSNGQTSNMLNSCMSFNLSMPETPRVSATQDRKSVV